LPEHFPPGGGSRLKTRIFKGLRLSARWATGLLMAPLVLTGTEVARQRMILRADNSSLPARGRSTAAREPAPDLVGTEYGRKVPLPEHTWQEAGWCLTFEAIPAHSRQAR
jgi:hypothetical protein